MTVEERVQAILIAAPTVTSLVPATRIRAGSDRQNDTAPYIAHFPVAWAPAHTHDAADVEGLQTCEIYQVSIFGSKYTSGRNVVKPIITALNGHHSDGTSAFWTGGPFYRHEDDVDIDSFVLEFKISAPLS